MRRRARVTIKRRVHSIRLPEPISRELKAAAYLDGISISEWVREAVILRLRRPQTGTRPVPIAGTLQTPER